jgi:hypothetical protein
MWLIRCSGSARGFRVDGKFYPFHSWTIVDAPTENELRERLLTCLEVEAATDARLAPFPIDTTDPEMKTPTLEGLAEQVKEWRGRFEALTTSIHEVTQRADAAIAENSSLKEQLARSNAAALQKRVGELEGRITELEGQLAAREEGTGKREQDNAPAQPPNSGGSNAVAPVAGTTPKPGASGAQPAAVGTTAK